ncbi:MAG: ankyrin repeat domain-containing protein, partial [Bacteroidota bacterium]
SEMNHACKNGHLDLVKYLVKKGLKLDDTHMSNACKSGHLNLVQYFVKKSLALKPEHMEKACENGHLDLVKYLVENENGLNPSQYNLRKACENGHLSLVKYLGAQGLTINSYYLQEAKNNNHTDLFKYLKENFQALAQACKEGNLAQVKDLVEKKGLQPGFSEMNHACKNGHLDLVKYLVKKGLKLDDTHMSNACKSGHLKLVKYLNAQGLKLQRIYMYDAKANVADYLTQKFQALTQACDKNNLEIVRDLVETQRLAPSFAEMDHACENGSLKVIKYLSAQGLNLYYAHMKSACESGKVELVQYLETQGLKLENHKIMPMYKGGHINLYPYLKKRFAEAIRQTCLENKQLHIPNEITNMILDFAMPRYKYSLVDDLKSESCTPFVECTVEPNDLNAIHELCTKNEQEFYTIDPISQEKIQFPGHLSESKLNLSFETTAPGAYKIYSNSLTQADKKDSNPATVKKAQINKKEKQADKAPNSTDSKKVMKLKNGLAFFPVYIPLSNCYATYLEDKNRFPKNVTCTFYNGSKKEAEKYKHKYTIQLSSKYTINEVLHFLRTQVDAAQNPELKQLFSDYKASHWHKSYLKNKKYHKPLDPKTKIIAQQPLDLNADITGPVLNLNQNIKPVSNSKPQLIEQLLDPNAQLGKIAQESQDGNLTADILVYTREK